MMVANSLCFIVPSDVFFGWPSPCRRACHAGANPAYHAPHFAQPPALSSYVQASCLERAWPMALAAFVGGLAASSTAPPGRRRLERERQAKAEGKAEGKIKGRGTQPLENPVCTWGWRGTRQRPTACRESAQRRIGIGEGACLAHLAVLALDGGTS